jgi:hypothetical protein
MKILLLLLPAILCAQSAPVIFCKSTTVAVGQSATFIPFLAAPADTGGVFLTMLIYDTGIATINPVNQLINEGQLLSQRVVTVTGVAPGSTVIYLRAWGSAVVSCPVTVTSGTVIIPPPPVVVPPVVVTGDTQAPTPVSLAAVAGSTSVSLAWTPSTDNVGVVGYRITRNNALLASQPGITYTDTTVSASSSYSYSVAAYDAAGNVAAPSNIAMVTTAAGGGGICLSSCGSITAPGRYGLSKSLVAAVDSPACIDIHDTRDVHLDCEGKSISVDRATNRYQQAMTITNTSDYSVKNCGIRALNTQVSGAGWTTLLIEDSPRGTLSGNTIDGYGDIRSGDDIRVDHSTIVGGFQFSSVRGVFEDNVMPTDPNIFRLILGPTAGMRVRRNRIHGGWDGVTFVGSVNGKAVYPAGADDAIILNGTLGDEDLDLIVEDNDLSYAWDAGFENARHMRGVTVRNNRISNIGYACIGGWWGNSLRANTFSNNTCTSAWKLFAFWRADQLNEGETSTLYFLDNVITGNTMINPRVSNDDHAVAFFAMQNMPTGASLVSGNNRVADNDWGPGGQTYFYPLSSIVQ